ncbi:helix-turn-helix domain-containing protein [Erythrobacter donghaensis]|uniref:helix-turn-helix domain-containing protein n=1 Tax=Erythrobacter donghaensis TaxID=267135 RepID=UPI00082D0873|nr:AraC family transcriptional regulator [Erythrobacter donghaensis]
MSTLTGVRPPDLSGTSLDRMQLSTPLAFDNLHRTPLFNGLRLHRPQPDVRVATPGLDDIVVTIWRDGARWCDRSVIGKRLEDAPLKADSVSVMPPGSDWSFQLVSDGGTDDIFYINPTEYAEILGADRPASQAALIRPTPESRNTVLVQAAKAYAAEFAKRDAFSKLAFESIALRVCVEIARSYCDHWSVSSADHGGQPNFSAMAIAKQYILDNLDEPIGLRDIAAQAGLSQYHFCRRFKEVEGLTPYQFVREQRLRRARELLEKSDLAVSEIAYACGYSSQSHLTSLFKARFNMPPGRWRRLRRS